ncbi:MAG: hypothetical protein EPO40_19710 [Myxococcaceae bacterium]|nr:MAG: hypothetical protein EPO40_19710 [Myxococcaceae bacterium]
MSALRATYSGEARAEWENLLVMAALPGRPVALRTVRRLGRAAGVDASEITRVAREIGAAS